MKAQTKTKKLRVRTNIRAGGTAVGNPGNVYSADLLKAVRAR